MKSMGTHTRYPTPIFKKINERPCIRPGDELALDRFSIFLSQCRSAMSTLTYLSILNHPHNLQSVVTKLPFTLQDRWRREANKRRVAGGVIPPLPTSSTSLMQKRELRPTQSSLVKRSVVWMVPQIDLIVPTKAEVKVLASLKRLGTIMLLHITPPVTQQMWPLTNSQAHALPLASVSCATRTMIWTTVKTT